MMVTAVDEFGAKGTGTIAILIEGANDLADITGPEEVKIDLASQTSVDGVLQVADLDYGEAVFGTIASSQTPKSGSQDGVLTAEGNYGVLTMNAATGAWHYTANSRISAPEGVDCLKDDFFFTSLDHTAKFNLTIALLDAPTTTVGVPIDWNDSNYS